MSTRLRSTPRAPVRRPPTGCQRPRPDVRKTLLRKGSGGVRVASNTLVTGLRTLYGKGGSVYSLDMEYETVVDLSGDPAFVGGFVVSAGRSCSEYDIQFLSESLRTQTQDHSPQPTHTNRPGQTHDQEPPGQDLSRMIATHDPEKDHDMDIRVANAHTHPQNTHAHATSCPLYTCTHRGWR